MPDFRPLFFIAKVLNCCCCSRHKPESARESNHPYGTRHDQRAGSSSENVSDYSEYSVPPAYPGGPMNHIHPDEFEVLDELNEAHGRDEFGFDLQKSRSLVPYPPTPRPSSPATTRPSTAKPDTMRPSTAESTTTKTISDEPVAGPSVIAETTATDSVVTESPPTGEPGTPKPVVVEPITDKTALDKSVLAESEATGLTTKKPVADETSATKLGGPEPITDEPAVANVELAEASPLKSDIEASEVKDGTTEVSSEGVGPTKNKDKDKGKDKVSE